MHHDQPKVSIVTVTYNSAATLADTLASVASQDYPALEHVIVDGGSADGTLDLVRAVAASDPRVVWMSEPDNGIYDAMNKGIALATGEVIGMLNSDDFLIDVSVVTDLVGAMATEGAHAVYADLQFVDPVDTRVVKRSWRAGRGRFTRGWCPPHPTLYVRADTLRRIGTYRPDFKISADYDLMLRLFADPKIRVTYLARTIVRMRVGGASTRSLASNLTGFREAGISLRSRKVRFPAIVNALRIGRKLMQLVRPRLTLALRPVTRS